MEGKGDEEQLLCCCSAGWGKWGPVWGLVHPSAAVDSALPWRRCYGLTGYRKTKIDTPLPLSLPSRRQQRHSAATASLLGMLADRVTRQAGGSRRTAHRGRGAAQRVKATARTAGTVRLAAGRVRLALCALRVSTLSERLWSLCASCCLTSSRADYDDEDEDDDSHELSISRLQDVLNQLQVRWSAGRRSDPLWLAVAGCPLSLARTKIRP